METLAAAGPLRVSHAASQQQQLKRASPSTPVLDDEAIDSQCKRVRRDDLRETTGAAAWSDEEKRNRALHQAASTSSPTWCVLSLRG